MGAAILTGRRRRATVPPADHIFLGRCSCADPHYSSLSSPWRRLRRSSRSPAPETSVRRAVQARHLRDRAAISASASCCRTSSSWTSRPPTARSSAIPRIRALPMPDDDARAHRPVPVRPQVPPLRDRQRPRRQQAARRHAAARATSTTSRRCARWRRSSMPGKMLNTAVNFFSHVGEGGGRPRSRRRPSRHAAPNRGVPYLFLKPTEGVIIGNGDNVVLPCGRDRIDWEVELAIVIGRAAKYVPASKAARTTSSATWSCSTSPTAAAGRPAASRASTGSSARATTPSGRWVRGSSPRSSTAIPMKNLRQTLSVGGQQMQEGHRGRHDPLDLTR